MFVKVINYWWRKIQEICNPTGKLNIHWFALQFLTKTYTNSTEQTFASTGSCSGSGPDNRCHQGRVPTWLWFGSGSPSPAERRGSLCWQVDEIGDLETDINVQSWLQLCDVSGPSSASGCTSQLCVRVPVILQYTLCGWYIEKLHKQLYITTTDLKWNNRDVL